MTFFQQFLRAIPNRAVGFKAGHNQSRTFSPLFSGEFQRIHGPDQIRIDCSHWIIFKMPCRRLAGSMDNIVHLAIYFKRFAHILLYQFQILSITELTILRSCPIHISDHAYYFYSRTIEIISEHQCRNQIEADKTTSSCNQNPLTIQLFPIILASGNL